ncbi:hypothetical protein GF342_04060 [Candidatus Woesearchaeota archaeon]|nr:hypothetical protein [Candidatus Woesearchaeota archaeon]
MDDLGILFAAKQVVDAARFVRINVPGVVALAERLTLRTLPALETELYFSDGTWRTANYCLAITCLDFCFWGEPKWSVVVKGKRYTGSFAMLAAVKQAMGWGAKWWDAQYLQSLTRDDLGQILRGDAVEIPLLQERLTNLHEAGRVLEQYDGRFTTMIEQAEGSAVRLIQRVAQEFPQFRDRAVYKGREVSFYKRAQLLCANLQRVFAGKKWGAFQDVGQLAALADYKIPQILRHFGVLEYATPLASQVDNKALLAPGSEEEVEIRASMIWVVELIRQFLAARGVEKTAMEIDYLLWYEKFHVRGAMKPHHRTRTIFY